MFGIMLKKCKHYLFMVFCLCMLAGSVVNAEEETEVVLPENLQVEYSYKELLAGETIKMTISADNAELYEIFVLDTETEDVVYSMQTESAGTYEWLIENEGRYTLFFQASNSNGTVESTRYYIHIVPPSGQWVQVGPGWMYEMPRGNFAVDIEILIDGQYYRFDERGYMMTGWQLIDGQWFYYQPSGERANGWVYDNHTFYYTNELGVMQTGWQYVDGIWYYMNSSGAMLTDWLYYGGHWYYLDYTGAMQTGWEQVRGKWYYMIESGEMQTGWKYIDGIWYYLKSSGEMQTGWLEDGGVWYYLDGSGAMAVGWKYVDGYKYYFDASGAMDDDLRDVVPGPYYIKVNRKQNCVTVYGKDVVNGYVIPVKAFLCSTGGTKTPLGTFTMSTQYRWHQLYGAVGQYCSRITGHVLFHSIPYYTWGDIYSLMPGQFNRLGTNASAGCVRLTTGDAKWIYDNCHTGSTQITIYDGESSSPLGRPVLPKIPYYQNWDPTDPAITGI